MKRMATICVILILLAIIGWQQYHIYQMKRERDGESAKVLQQLPSNHRKTDCAQHIGKLEGSKHDAALAWFKPFYDENYPMTEEDWKTCKEF